MQNQEPYELEYQKKFKNIYYNLYSNGSSSRAERIVSDITKILMCKLICENKNDNSIQHYIDGDSKLEDTILPLVKEEYPHLFEQFEGFSLTDRSIKYCFSELENIRLSNAPAHIIGDAFQAIIGPQIRGDKGQFFTPKNVVQCMIEILAPQKEDIIIDPACGTGGFLSESHIMMQKKYRKIRSRYIGIDKDKDLADLAFGMTQIISKGQSNIYNFNSLEIVFDDHPLHNLIGSADIVLTNPPFGAKIGITDEKILKHFEFGYNWAFSKKDNIWYKLDSVSRTQDPQILFLELCINLLKPGGKLGIILPEGVFGNKTYGYAWQYLLDRGKILGMIDCPRNTFQPSTDTKTNILFYQKGIFERNNTSWVAVAKHCGHDKRGRMFLSNGNPIINDFAAISHEYKCKTKSEIWLKAKLNGQYFVPRYYAVQKESLELLDYGEITTLGELIESGALTIKSGHEVGSDAYGTGIIPFVRTSDINNFEISCDPTNSVSEEVYMQYKDQQDLKAGDILFIADGRYRIGKTAILNEFNTTCIIQSHIDILSINANCPLSPYELLYILNFPSVQNQIRSLIFIQSTLGTLGNRIKEICIPIPVRTTEWQQKIELFKNRLDTRAKLLSEIKQFEYSFEL
ncbi:N-6 DNA methylase [Lacrimispora sp.]|uniref:N-6 DNA methylase n=1 Tax=Lacrimispora sp. TaxID=2719234 RepID=UPI0028A9043A|nr:N-6 DNA methylase [Lacrimispora sp.]